MAHVTIYSTSWKHFKVHLPKSNAFLYKSPAINGTLVKVCSFILVRCCLETAVICKAVICGAVDCYTKRC